jgi:hypothetical protein
VRRGDFSLLLRCAHKDFTIVELRVDMNVMWRAYRDAIPRGETAATFPAEPTHSYVRAGSASQGRLLSRLEEVALIGAYFGAPGNVRVV